MSDIGATIFVDGSELASFMRVQRVRSYLAIALGVFALCVTVAGSGHLAIAQVPEISAPPGTITGYGGLTPPPGWLLADGDAVSRTQYAELFAAIQTTYGAGNGTTTFNLPDLLGRVPVGKGTNADADALAETEGLAAGDRSPKHTHGDGTLSSASHDHGDGTLQAASHTHSLSNAGAAKFTLNSNGGSTWIFARQDTAAGTFGANDLNHAFNLGTGFWNSSTNRTGVGLYGNTDSGSADVAGSTGSASADVAGSTASSSPAYLVITYIIKT